MRKREAEKVLDAEIKHFGRHISCLTFEDHIITSQFRESHVAFLEYMQRAKDHEDPSFRRFILRRAIIGSSSTGSDITKSPIVHFPLGRTDIKFREKEHALIENLNRQYSWLVVSAYERYECFLKQSYACMGYLDRGFWLCDDYGSIGVSEVGKRKLAWFRERVTQRDTRQFRHDASHALQQFRKAFPAMLSYEKVALPAGRLSLYSDAAFHQAIDTLPVGLTCSLAGELRHAIVHNHGVIESIQWLCNEIGIRGREKIAVVTAHCKEVSGGARIWLVNDREGLLDYKFLDLRVSHILDSLCAHACLLYKACISHFGGCAYWERKPQTRQARRIQRKQGMAKELM